MVLILVLGLMAGFGTWIVVGMFFPQSASVVFTIKDTGINWVMLSGVAAFLGVMKVAHK